MTQSGDEIGLLGGLGLDIIGVPVGVVARPDLAAGHGPLTLLGPHLLDVVVVIGVDDGGHIEVGQADPAVEVDLTEHAGGVGLALLDGPVVADPVVGEGDSLVLLVVDGDGRKLLVSGVGSEGNGAGNTIQSPEGNAGGADGSGGGDEGHGGSSEMHFKGVVVVLGVSVIKKECLWLSRELASEEDLYVCVDGPGRCKAVACSWKGVSKSF